MFKTIKNAINNTIDATIINAFTILSRYFVTLDPVLNSYYEMAAPITFTGDFEIEVEFSTTTTGSYRMIFGYTTSSSTFISINPSATLRLRLQGATYDGSITVNDGELHLISIKRVSSLVSLYVDGVLDGTFNTTNVSTFDYIGRYYEDFSYFDGIIANAKFTDKSGASDVVTTFKLDQATANTEYSQENVFGSEEVVNGDFATDSDWTLSNQVSIANGVLNIQSNDGSYQYATQTITGAQIGKIYEATFNITRVGDTGIIKVAWSGDTSATRNAIIPSTIGIHKVIWPHNGTTNAMSIGRNSGGEITDIDVSDFSLKEITNAVTYKNIPQSARELYTLAGNTWTDAAGNTIEVAS